MYRSRQNRQTSIYDLQVGLTCQRHYGTQKNPFMRAGSDRRVPCSRQRGHVVNETKHAYADEGMAPVRM